MSTKNLLITDRQKVREVFNKSEKDVMKDVEILKDWLKSQRHLPELPSNNMIETFLVTNKFSIERTKPKLDMYYTIRPLIPEIFENKNPSLPHMQQVYDIAQYCPLPKLTKELYRVHVMRVVGDAEDFDTFNFFAHQLNVFEVRTQEDLAVGDVYIIDYEHLSMGHVSKMTPMHIKKAVTILEKVFSNRLKGIHIINYPTYVDILMNIAKVIVKPKLMQRVVLHNTLDTLYDYVPKEILPKDYGGEELSLKELNDLWRQKLKEYQDRFDKLDKLKVNEDLRPAPLQNHEVLGYHGNFKKLDVD